MFRRFSTPARDVIVCARSEAQQLNHTHIGSEHLLLALLSKDAGVAHQVLHQAGLDAQRVRTDIERLAGAPARPFDEADAEALRTIGIDLDAVLARIEETFGPAALRPPATPPRRETLWGDRARSRSRGSRLTPRLKKILELSLRESIRLGHNYLGVEHLLLALLRDGQGQGFKIITDAGLSPQALREATIEALTARPLLSD